MQDVHGWWAAVQGSKLGVGGRQGGVGEEVIYSGPNLINMMMSLRSYEGRFSAFSLLSEATGFPELFF